MIESEGIAACMRLNAKLTRERDELYEALEEIANVAHDYPGDAFWFMQNVARSALAKARGESPDAK